MKSLLLLPLLLCGSITLLGQNSKDLSMASADPDTPEMPSSPLLNNAPEFAQWEVAFTYPDEQKQDKNGSPQKLPPSAEFRLVKTSTIKTGTIIHEEAVDVRNRKTEQWFNGPIQYSKSGEDRTWYQSGGSTANISGGDHTYSPLPANGFRDLDWIEPQNYAGTIPYGPGKCLVFVPGGYRKLNLKDSAGLAKRLETADKIAYIDATTRLPIAVRTRTEVRTYKFATPPTERLTFPVDLASQIKSGQEARARLESPAARPY